MGEIIKGAPAAKALTEELAARAEALKAKGVTPTLAILRVGERGDDIAYENGALKRCEKIGIEVKRILLPADAGKAEVLSAIEEINNDKGIHGCLMFRPLPDKETENEAAAALLPAKDSDCMTKGSLAAVFAGGGDGFAPCTAEAVVTILKHYGVDLTGKKVAVVGRSLVIGKPVSMLLQKENATVTMCHTKTKDLAAETKRADIIVACAGKAKMIGPEHVSAGQVIIDVGINVDADGNMCGDVDTDAVLDTVSKITPVPGGVGTVTTSVLAKHVIEAAEKTL